MTHLTTLSPVQSSSLVVNKAATLKDLTTSEFDYGLIVNSNHFKLSFLNTTDSYLALLPLRDWITSSLELNFSSLKLNLLTNLTGGFNTLIGINLFASKLSIIDLLSGYSLQQSNLAATHQIAAHTIINNLTDSLSMMKGLNTYYNAFWKVFKSTIEEERSSFLFKNYSSVDFKLPIVMQPTPALLGSLQKNSVGTFFDLLTIQKFDKPAPLHNLTNV